MIFLLLFSFSVQAKVFELPYLKFSLPDSWNCQTQKTETTCQSNLGVENKQSVLLINAKETTPAETLESFHQQLSQPRGVGTVKKVEYIQVGDTKWVQAYHSNSELPNYETIYWITRVQSIAILVTYSFLSKYSKNLYPLGQKLPQSFQVNMAEVARLSKIAQMAQAQGQAVTAPSDTPSETAIAPPEPQKQEPQSLGAKLSKLLKGPYGVMAVVLCVILIFIAFFLR